MNDKYLRYIALADISSGFSYKILLLLIEKECTQAQLAILLNIKRQNVPKYMKELGSLGLIEVDRIEGRNKFYRLVTDLNKIKEIIPGQIKF